MESYPILFRLPSGTGILKVILFFQRDESIMAQGAYMHRIMFSKTRKLIEPNLLHKQFAFPSFCLPEASVLKGGNDTMPLHGLLQLYVDKRA